MLLNKKDKNMIKELPKTNKVIFDASLSIVTHIKDAYSSDSMSHLSVADVLRQIRTEKYERLISEERKQNLPAWAFMGTFTGSVKNANFEKSSGMFHFDIDKVDVKDVRKKLTSDPYVYAHWMSPSRNGIKGLIKASGIKSDDDFKAVFSEIYAHFEKQGIIIDKACKNVGRLCYVCSDRTIVINAGSLTWERVPNEPEQSQSTAPTRAPKKGFFGMASKSGFLQSPSFDEIGDGSEFEQVNNEVNNGNKKKNENREEKHNEQVVIKTKEVQENIAAKVAKPIEAKSTFFVADGGFSGSFAKILTDAIVTPEDCLKSESYQEQLCERIKNILESTVEGGFHSARYKAGLITGGLVSGGWSTLDILRPVFDQWTTMIHDSYGDGVSKVRKETKAYEDGYADGLREPITTDFLGARGQGTVKKEKVAQIAAAENEEESEIEWAKKNLVDVTLPIKHLSAISYALSDGMIFASKKATNHAAITVIASLVARSFAHAGKMSLFVGNISKTSEQIRALQNNVERVLDYVGCPVYSNVDKELLNVHFYRDKSTITYVPSNLGSDIGLISRQTSGQIKGFLQTIIDIQEKDKFVATYKKERETIYDPSVNLYSGFGESEIYQFAKSSQFNKGIFSMFLCSVSRNDDFKRASLPIASKVKQACEIIKNHTKESSMYVGNMANAVSEKQDIVFGIDKDLYAEKIIDFLENHCKKALSLANTINSNFLNLCAVIAAWNGESVTAELADKCLSYVIKCTYELNEHLSIHSNDDLSSNARTAVIAFLSDSNGATLRDMRNVKKLYEHNKEEREAIILSLLDDGVITQEKVGRKIFYRLK